MPELTGGDEESPAEVVFEPPKDYPAMLGVGDPLTLVAGLLRMPFALFLVFVAIGKAARYGVVLWLTP